MPVAEDEVRSRRLGAWEHFLFLAALSRRPNVDLASRVRSEVCAVAAQVELEGRLTRAEVLVYRRLLEHLDRTASLPGLGERIAARVAWLHEQAREEERARQAAERRELRLRFESRVKEIISAAETALPVYHPAPPADLLDVRLALAWTLKIGMDEAARRAPSVAEAMERFGHDAGFRRNLSARLAERVAAAIYGKLHPGDVHDVAGRGDSDDWTKHDLLVAGRPIDVKNVRRWRTRGLPREETRVAEFKVSRAGVPVTIAGTRSPWVAPDAGKPSDEEEQPDLVRYLGETDAASLDALCREFASDSLAMDFSRPRNPAERFLPHWLFDQPEGVYIGRERVRSLVSPELFADRWFWSDAGLRPLPVALAAGMDISRMRAAPAAGWQMDLYRTLLDRARRLGQQARPRLSLPVIYLSVLDHFLAMARAPEPQRAAFEPAGYRAVLFFGSGEQHERWPAGVLDATRTVAALVDTLGVLWRAREKLSGLRHFQLLGRGLLRGSTDAGPERSWTTLVAYCGDCRFAPLVLGSHTVCPKCRRLVCRACGFCSAPPPGLEASRHDPSCQGGPRRAARMASP